MNFVPMPIVVYPNWFRGDTLSHAKCPQVTESHRRTFGTFIPMLFSLITRSSMNLAILLAQSSLRQTTLFSSKSWGISYTPVQQNLRVAQLVERETVRVALYLEVACSTQALEIPF